ncbi:hypothetical protein F9K33_14765 [bacterium]|nr:MAG: hypothetical protein F9K33_14765 [bacterium]
MTKAILLCLICLLVSTVVHGQTVGELEKQFRLLNQSIQAEQAVLDSLNALMENKAKDIESEKKSAAPDQDKIIKSMSHAVTLSNQIKEYQKNIAAGRLEAEDCRIRLERFYTKTIDSLRQMDRSGKYEGDKYELRNQILIWTEKRIFITPLVSTLSFDPQKVQRIELTDASDPTDKAMMEDYIKKALKEIDSHIMVVTATRKEYEEMADLRRRTTEFINEAYEQGRISSMARSQTFKNIGTDILGNPIGQGFTAVHVRSVAGLMQQLNTGWLMSPGNASLTSTNTGIAQEEYIQLLKQAENLLRTYREIVQKKLK